MRERATLDQLPRSSAEYYAVSTADGLREYEFKGKDACGRRVYQPHIDGEPYGRPRALLTYREYVAAVKAAHARAPRTPMGVPRWTEPTGIWSEQ